MPDFRSLRRGRLPCDPGVLSRAPTLARHAIALAAPAASLSQRAKVPYAPQMHRNDELGDCGAVGIANGAQADAALRGYALDIATDRVVDGLYARGGYREGHPETDTGLVLVDVLAGLEQKAWYAEDQLPLTGPWVTIDPGDRAMLARAQECVGWVYAGVDLAPADLNVDLWDTSLPVSADDPTPSPELGHCIVIYWYAGLADDDLVFVGTWGVIMRATWRWVRSRLREAHVVLFRPVMGVDYDRVCADAAAFGRMAA